MSIVARTAPRSFTLSTLAAVLASGAFGAACTEEASQPLLAPGPDVAITADDTGTLRATAVADEAAAEVGSMAFDTWEDLYDFAVADLGGERVVDASGRTVGVSGVSMVTGDVAYVDREAGVTFRDSDLVRAILGGADGVVYVGGEPQTVGPGQGGPGYLALALGADSRNCVGNDCVSGHSWVGHYGIYHSAGSRTTQSSGGTNARNYLCCVNPRGTLTQRVPGRYECKVTIVTPREQLPLGTPPQSETYYTPAQTCTEHYLNNQLTVGVRPIAGGTPPSWNTQVLTRGVTNATQVELANWAVGFRVELGPITDVKGLCGYHWSSRGGNTKTRAGDVNDSTCNMYVPNGPTY